MLRQTAPQDISRRNEERKAPTQLSHYLLLVPITVHSKR